MTRLHKILDNYVDIIPLIFKLFKIIINTIIGSFFSNSKASINYYLTVDVESAFINNTDLPHNSYETDIHKSSLKIAELAKKNNVKVIFFINYPEIEIFRQQGKPIDKLINCIHSAGHSIQLHIHPALINPEKSPDLSFYPLERISEMLSEGKKIICDITGEKPIAFRAGGYSVGDWPKISQALQAEGFLIDSSVFSGARNLHGAIFDYSGLENMRPYYPSSETLKKERFSKTGLVEFPITAVVRCRNNLEASFFRFDPRRSFFLLMIFTKYLVYRNDVVYINMIYHSKEVFDKNEQLSKSFIILKSFLSYLNKYNVESKSLETVLDCLA